MTPKTRVIVAPPWVFIPARELSSFEGMTPGLYFRAEIAIVHASCEECGSELGEPCRGKLRTYKTQVCQTRRWAAAEGKLPSFKRLARVELHLNDPDDMHGGQHDCVKVCWPLKETTMEKLKKEKGNA